MLKKMDVARIRVVLTCMLANNVTFGLVYGSFGAFLASNEQAFGVGRATISFGMSAAATTLALSALVLGNYTNKLQPRRMIAGGLVFASAGFIGLGLTGTFQLAMLFWAMLGLGGALGAILCPVTLCARLFPGSTGKVIAAVNLPIMLFLGPWAVTEALPVLGRQGTYLLCAALPLLVLGIVRFIPDTDAITPGSSETIERGTIASRPEFWLLSLAVGLAAGAGTAFVTHGIAYAMSRGTDAMFAATMISAYSGTGIAGAVIFGWLADRIGAAHALCLSAVIQALCWAALALSPTTGFIVVSALLGVTNTPLNSLHGAAMAQLFGSSAVGRAMGYSYAIKLPFLFAISPLVGLMFVVTGDYTSPFLIVSCLMGGAAILALLSASIYYRRRSSTAARACPMPVASEPS